MLRNILQVGPAILARAGGQNLASIKMGNILRAIANTQNRQLTIEFFKIKTRRIILPYRIRAARKDDTFYCAVNFGKMIKGMYLAVDIELPDTARDELGKL